MKMSSSKHNKHVYKISNKYLLSFLFNSSFFNSRNSFNFFQRVYTRVSKKTKKYFEMSFLFEPIFMGVPKILGDYCFQKPLLVLDKAPVLGNRLIRQRLFGHFRGNLFSKNFLQRVWIQRVKIHQI